MGDLLEIKGNLLLTRSLGMCALGALICKSSIGNRE